MGSLSEEVRTEVLCGYICDLEAENTKLRELVSQLIYCAERVGNEDIFYYQPTRDGCGFDCAANGEHCSFAKMCDRARELGVEL